MNSKTWKGCNRVVKSFRFSFMLEKLNFQFLEEQEIWPSEILRTRSAPLSFHEKYL